MSEFSDEEYESKMNEMLKASKNNINEEDREALMEVIKELVEYVEDNMDFIFKKERDKNIAYAICNILKRYDKINSYQKKYLYILIREYSGEETNYITKVLKKFKSVKSKILNKKTEDYLKIDKELKNLFNI